MKIRRKLLVLLVGGIMSVLFVQAAFAASYQSLVVNPDKEFELTALTYSYNKFNAGDQVLGAMFASYNNELQTKNIDYFKINDGTTTAYYNRTALAYYFGKSATLEEALTKTPISNPVTGISRFYSDQIIFEGPKVTNANSSLKIGRTGDSSVWDCSENQANSSNPIGPISFIFGKDFNKQDLTKVTVYVDDVLPNTSDEELIKQLLFGEFVTRSENITQTNSLDGNIFLSYSELKQALKIYNNGNDVTSVKIQIIATDNKTVSMTLNIN